MTNRIGIGVNDATRERLRVVTQSLQVSQSRLVSAIVSVMSNEEIRTVLARYDRLTKIEGEIRQIADQSMLGYIRGKSVADLETMLAAARNAGKAS